MPLLDRSTLQLYVHARARALPCCYTPNPAAASCSAAFINIGWSFPRHTANMSSAAVASSCAIAVASPPPTSPPPFSPAADTARIRSSSANSVLPPTPGGRESTFPAVNKSAATAIVVSPLPLPLPLSLSLTRLLLRKSLSPFSPKFAPVPPSSQERPCRRNRRRCVAARAWPPNSALAGTRPREMPRWPWWLQVCLSSEVMLVYSD